MGQQSDTEETRALQPDTEQAIGSEGSLEPALQATFDESLPVTYLINLTSSVLTNSI